MDKKEKRGVIWGLTAFLLVVGGTMIGWFYDLSKLSPYERELASDDNFLMFFFALIFGMFFGLFVATGFTRDKGGPGSVQ